MRSDFDANLDCLFLLGSSAANMWTVPWSLDTQMRDASWLKLMLQKHVLKMLLILDTCMWLGVLHHNIKKNNN